MACITIGLDTSRVYNKKQPPGGACTDLFGEVTATDATDKKVQRVQPDKPATTPERTARKSQPSPSVCPVTGETIGHNLPKPEAPAKVNKEAEPKKVADDKKQDKLVNCTKEEVKPAEDKKEMKEEKRVAPEPRKAVVEAQDTVEPSPVPATPPAQSSSEVSPTPAPQVATPPPVVSSNPTPVAAPVVKSRRVPPGGHTHALW